MQNRDDGEALVHRFLNEHTTRLGCLSDEERRELLEAIRQLGLAWKAHRHAATEQERTRALREVDAAMAELDLLAERVLAVHSDDRLAQALRSLPI